MLSQPAVIFKFLRDKIQKVAFETEFDFKEADDLRARIGVNPHAVLKSMQSDGAEKQTDPIAYRSPLLLDVEDDHAPLAVPLLWGSQRP